MDFGDDRCGSDGKRESIAVKKSRLGAGMGYLGEIEAHGINEEMVGRSGEPLDGGEHGEA